MYKVIVKKKTAKRFNLLPKNAAENLSRLLDDLRDKGPVRPEYPNYSKLGPAKHHCHLARKWVACWSCIENLMEIEVYYVGSRESAPY